MTKKDVLFEKKNSKALQQLKLENFDYLFLLNNCYGCVVHGVLTQCILSWTHCISPVTVNIQVWLASLNEERDNILAGDGVMCCVYVRYQ